MPTAGVELFFWLFVTGGVVSVVNSRGLKPSSLKKEGINCKDESGKEVPWYIVYKLPKDQDSKDKARQLGSQYFYLLPDADKWVLSNRLITKQDSILAVTLGPLSDKKQKIAYVMYNDQPPDVGKKPKPKNRPGHTKGLILANSKSGLWLEHSAPHFPLPGRKSYSYWEASLKFGQIFICISLDNNQIESTLAEILTYSEPTFFDYDFPKAVNFPKLKEVVTSTRKRPKEETTFQNFTLSSGGIDFKIFAKSSKYTKGIYSDWLAPTFKTDLQVQTWRNGNGGKVLSECNPKVSDVVNIKESKLNGIKFNASKDHSKWAVSTNKRQPWTCIADLNRVESQKRRAGVAICMSNAKTWQAFSDSVAELETCKFNGKGKKT